MGWKKKEKPLTPDEAIAQAKKELAPFWFGSEPLLAAIRSEAGASVLPLSPNFVEMPRLFAFIDPTDFVGESALNIVREWHRRYSAHHLGFVVVFRAPTPFLKSAADWLRKFQIQFPAVYDQGGLFAEAFGIQNWPGVVVQRWAAGPGGQPEEVARGSGSKWVGDVEEKVQLFLRKSDPGLSFPLSFSPLGSLVGQARMDFGLATGKPVSTLFQFIELRGNWKESDDCISPSDPSAVALIHAPSPVISIVAQSSIESQVTKILIDPADGAFAQEWIPEGVAVDDNGRGIARVQLFGLYELLTSLPPNQRNVKLSFPDANTIPIQLYGLRFGAKS